MTIKMYRNTLFEVSTILKQLDKYLVEKIPKDVRENIELNKSNDYIYNYDESKSLHEQKMLKTTEQYLTMLFLRYIASEDEKNEVLRAMHENEKLYQKKQREQYNPDVLFNKKSEITLKENEIIDETTLSIKYKESLFTKIVNKLKSFFNK